MMIILGPKTQRYCETFLQHCTEKEGQLVIASEDLKNVFRGSKLYPTPTQVLNIVHQAYKSQSPNHAVTFGSFCAGMYEFECRLSLAKQTRDIPSPEDDWQNPIYYQSHYSPLKSSKTMHFSKESKQASSLDRDEIYESGSRTISRLTSSCHSSPLSSTMDIVYNKLGSQSKTATTASLQNFFIKPHEVFLGGACNPTTWRWEIAIPYLKHNFTTYFNPQKDNWSPEMIESEEIAKRSAKLLLFVLDCRETRGIVSLIEVCHLAGAKKPLLVVLIGEKYTANTKINGQTLNNEEIDDLNRGLVLLNTFIDKMMVPVFGEMKSALQACSYLLKYNKHPSCLNSYSQIPDIMVGESLGEIRRCFNELDLQSRGFLSLDETCLALKLLFGLHAEFPSLFYQILRSHFLQRSEDEDSLDDVQISLDEFSALAVEMSEFLTSTENSRGFKQKRIRRKESNGNSPRLSSTYYTWLSAGFLNPVPKETRSEMSDMPPLLLSSPFLTSCAPLKKDVFLGGSCNGLEWREKIAIPFLLEHGITYYNPQTHPWDCSMFVKEELQKNACTVLFYFISSSSRSVASMCEAAFFVGQGIKSIVLCVEPFCSTSGGGADCLAKDYKRGRAYLTDMANQLHIPVYSKIENALSNLLDKVKGTWV